MRKIMTFAAAAALLAGCGTSTSDRALGGAALGAGAGAVAGTMVASPVTGALVGGAIGGTAGALTNPSEVNLGRPVWKR